MRSWIWRVSFEVMVNKYSEGYPGARYYGGNEFIDQAEAREGIPPREDHEVHSYHGYHWRLPKNAMVTIVTPYENNMIVHCYHINHYNHFV